MKVTGVCPARLGQKPALDVEMDWIWYFSLHGVDVDCQTGSSRRMEWLLDNVRTYGFISGARVALRIWSCGMLLSAAKRSAFRRMRRRLLQNLSMQGMV